MHKAQSSRSGRGHSFRWPSRPVVPDSRDIINPGHMVSTQLQRRWLALRREEGVVRQMGPFKAGARRAGRQGDPAPDF